MKRKSFLCSGLVFFLILFITAADDLSAGTQNREKEAGYALLDELVGTFRDMAQQGSGGKEKVDEALENLMAKAKIDKAEENIDPLFFRRFNRLLSGMKLFIVEDGEGILGELIRREISALYLDVKGEDLDTSQPILGPVADALSDEIINLYLHLDNLEKKAKMKADFEKGFRLGKNK